MLALAARAHGPGKPESVARQGSAWLAAEADGVLTGSRGGGGGGGGGDASSLRQLRPAALLRALGDIVDVLCEVTAGPDSQTTWVVARVEVR